MKIKNEKRENAKKYINGFLEDFNNKIKNNNSKIKNLEKDKEFDNSLNPWLSINNKLNLKNEDIHNKNDTLRMRDSIQNKINDVKAIQNNK